MLNTNERDGVLVIELDHGKVNALDLELLNAIINAFSAAGTAQAVVLTGADRAFSAGVDLRRIVEGGPDYTTEFLEALTRCFLAIFDHPAPVVAAINGPAIAAGCVIAAACDLRVMSKGPIGLVELAVGVPFPTAAIEIVRGLLGPKTADLVLTARTYHAAEALANGLADEITAPESLLDRAVQRANVLAALPPEVFAHTKRQLQRPTRGRIAAAPGDDDREVAQLWKSAPVRQAVENSLERRRGGR